MEKIILLCVEDQREVLTAIVSDLAFFDKGFVIEECESADEALDLVEEIDAEGDYLGVVLSDHVMPGKSGVAFLSELHKDPRFRHTKKVLITGLATHSDTIQAINDAAIDRYIQKPWQQEQLIQYVKELLTHFIILKGIDYQSWLPYLDSATLFKLIK
ncbi:MAG: response regulator [Bacteroidota bacterium]